MSTICKEIVFTKLFNEHAKALRNFLLYKYGNENLAEDKTQEAFIKLWQNCKDVTLEKAKAYLYTIARNSSLNDLAHQKIVLEYQKKNNFNSRTNENPEYILEQNQFHEKLMKAINNINETQRVAFLMSRIDGKKYHEIADELGISVKAVEKRIHLALLEIKKEIKNFR